MPYLLLYHIILSRYGYREYIKNKDVTLLNFIEWKEKIAYFLEENAEKIVEKLKILIDWYFFKNKGHILKKVNF